MNRPLSGGNPPVSRLTRQRGARRYHHHPLAAGRFGARSDVDHLRHRMHDVKDTPTVTVTVFNFKTLDDRVELAVPPDFEQTGHRRR